MNTYVLFDRKTGEIVRTHVHSGESYGRPEDLLKTLKADLRESIDILAVEELKPGSSYRVDVKGKKLVPVEPNKIRGFGGASVQRAGGDPGRTRTFFDIREKRR